MNIGTNFDFIVYLRTSSVINQVFWSGTISEEYVSDIYSSVFVVSVLLEVPIDLTWCLFSYSCKMFRRMDLLIKW